MYIYYFQHGLGQKRSGIEETILKLYLHYNYSSKILIPNFGNIKKNLSVLYNFNKKAINNKERVINVGGDHSMAIATVAASLDKYGQELKVLWFDAHADINTHESSTTKNLHGMPLAFLTDLEKDDNVFSQIETPLLFENLYYIGIRDLDQFEINIINEKNVNYVSCLNFNNLDYSTDLLTWVGSSPVHISFDVDCLDPTLMPCTGTTSPNGLSLERVLHTLEILHKNCNIVNFDLVELNLSIKPSLQNISIENFTKILSTII